MTSLIITYDNKGNVIKGILEWGGGGGVAAAGEDEWKGYSFSLPMQAIETCHAESISLSGPIWRTLSFALCGSTFQGNYLQRAGMFSRRIKIKFLSKLSQYRQQIKLHGINLIKISVKTV